MHSDPNDPIAQWDQDPGAAATAEEFKWRIAGAAQAEDVLDRAADRAAKAGIEAEVRAVEGGPAERLIDVASGEDFDLVVVGNVGMTGAKRMMLGNVPHRVSHDSVTDVLIVRTA
jgi:nucleotide-binding universal stress UspA family protein